MAETLTWWIKVGQEYINPLLVRKIVVAEDGKSAEIVYMDDASEYVSDPKDIASLGFVIGQR